MTVTDAAKQLNLKPSQLCEWMSTHRLIYKQQGARSWMAYQDRIDAGLMMHKTVTVERADSSNVYSQARLTAKGLATISRQIEKARQSVKLLGGAA